MSQPGRVITATSRTRHAHRRARPGSLRAQSAAGVRMGLREAGRNRVLWALLVAVPVIFVLAAVATTPKENTTLTVRESGRTLAQQAWLPDIHGGTMAPIAIGSLAALVGLFTVLDARSGDRRLSLAGFRPAALLASRLTVVTLGALVATASSLAVTATVFDARNWPCYIAASILIALTYALIGVLLGPLFGRLGGILIVFLIPFLDLGIEQSPMLRPAPPGWAHALPGYGPGRVLIDAALTPDSTRPALCSSHSHGSLPYRWLPPRSSTARSRPPPSQAAAAAIGRSCSGVEPRSVGSSAAGFRARAEVGYLRLGGIVGELGRIRMTGFELDGSSRNCRFSNVSWLTTRTSASTSERSCSSSALSFSRSSLSRTTCLRSRASASVGCPRSLTFA